MRQGRHGIKILGLSLLAALSVLAVTAAAAQAGEFTLTNGSPETTGTFTTKAVASETVAGTAGAGTLLVPTVVTINCTSGDVTSATVLLGGTAHATLLALGCTVEGAVKTCLVYPTKADMEAKTNAGDITASGLGLLILMGTAPVKHYLLLEEKEVGGVKTPFTTVYFSPEPCTLPLENVITGSTVLELPGALTQSVNQELKTIPQATLESLFPSDKLAFGGHPAWLDGATAQAHLTGANLNKKWGAE